MPGPSVRFTAIAGFALLLSASACSPIRTHQGYIIDADLVNSVQPGVDNRASVARTLGRPSFSGQFGDREWYYFARDTRQFAFGTPRPATQSVMKVTFDQAGTVTGIERDGIEKVVSIDPYSKTTPTAGRERSFLSELFGGIGSVGSMGGMPGSNGSNTGGRSTP